MCESERIVYKLCCANKHKSCRFVYSKICFVTTVHVPMLSAIGCFTCARLSYGISNCACDFEKNLTKCHQTIPIDRLHSAHPASMRARYGIASSQIQFELYYFYYNICLHAGAIYVLLLKCGYLYARAPTPSFAIENMCMRKESAPSAHKLYNS